MTFKVRLLLGAAAPLVFTLPAFAQVSISTATTTPVQTNTANNGAPSDITITSTGSIAVNTAGSTIATVNSNNTLTNNGSITSNNANDSTGVRIIPGVTGGYTGTGSITLLEDYTRTDTDNDTDLDGPLAQGSNRIGILVEAGGTLNGNIEIANSNNVATPAGGSISVEGNNSYGVSIRSDLNGSYIQHGVVSVTGSNSVGVDIREDVSGNIDIGSERTVTNAATPVQGSVGGGINVVGENAVGLRVLGDVGGEFNIDGTISSTGFARGASSNYYDPDQIDDPANIPAFDADDLLNNGAAVELRGSMARGLLINGSAVGPTDPTDDIKDVIQDFNENRNTAAITTYGSAPAVIIQSENGAAGSNITLGLVRETIYDTLDDDNDDNVSEVIATFNYDYGLINRGSIVSNGVNIGFSSTGLRVAGSEDGTHTTTIAGGIFNGDGISARGWEANATAVSIGAGASTPQIVNNGTIRADVNTETTHDSYGIRIDAGATVNSVTNNGLMFSSVRGFDGDAFAFQDLSGSVTSFTNTSRITAGHVDDDLEDDITSGPGLNVAVDLSANTTGVQFTQQDTVDNARIIGDVLLGSGNDRFDLLSGTMFGNIDFNGGSDTLNINSGIMSGNATFDGAGATVTLNGGEMFGNLALGAASGSLSFANNSIYNGEITRTGGGPLTIAVNNSSFLNLADGTLDVSSMSFTNNARVGLIIDNARVAGNTPIFNVAGTLDIANTTRFTPVFADFTNQSFTLRVMEAGTLNVGGNLSDMLADNGPFLYNMDLVQATPNAIDLVLDVKTATELGLNRRQGDAYSAVLGLMEEDDTLAAALTSISTAAEFQRSWADLLPGSDAAVMRVLASNASAAFGATANRLDMISMKPDAPGGAWTEEFGVFHRADATDDAAEVSGGGFGVSAGIDVISTGTALIGAYLSLESAELEEEGRTRAPLNVAQTSVGAYAGWLNGNLALNGVASVGFLDFTSERDIALGSIADTLRSSWSGQSYTAAARATYAIPLGWLDVKPFIGADFIAFQQDGYTETSTLDTTEGLTLIAGDSDGSLTTASYGVQFIGNLGGDDAFQMRPELSVGYRSILNWENTPATLRFAGGPATGGNFSLTPGAEPEDAITAGLGLTIDSQFVNIKLGYDAEIADSSMTHYGSVTLRMAFW